MTLSDRIAPELPYLRRFARALTGSQASGDAYVVAMLEALVEDRSVFQSELETKTAVFRAFLKVWSSVPMNTDGAEVPAPPSAHVDQQLNSLSRKPRQAFLLMSVEGLSAEQAALAMDTTTQEISRLIDEAGREIASQVATTVLIIEDEPLIALDLADLVTSLGHTVAATATTRREAVAAFEAHRPGLVLADVQLADGSSGLDAVRDILKSFSVPVIFITAYPERLLTGQRPEPAFLISKPFRPDTVKAIISQALFFQNKVPKSA